MHNSKEHQTEAKSLLSTKVIVGCVALIVLAFLAVRFFNVPTSALIWGGILLLCPLLHLWMMKDGGHKH